jgi:hypothetical protein
MNYSVDLCFVEGEHNEIFYYESDGTFSHYTGICKRVSDICIQVFKNARSYCFIHQVKILQKHAYR